MAFPPSPSAAQHAAAEEREGGESTDAPCCVLGAALLLEASGEPSLACIRAVSLRERRVRDVDASALARCVSLEALALSHNALSSSVQFASALRATLTDLNINFNAVTSLAGLAQCRALRKLYASHNRVREIEPIADLCQLRSLGLFSNRVQALDAAAAVLQRLPELRTLELGGNPCAFQPRYRHAIVTALPHLEELDGDKLGQCDRELACDFFAAEQSESEGGGEQHGARSDGGGQQQAQHEAQQREAQRHETQQLEAQRRPPLPARPATPPLGQLPAEQQQLQQQQQAPATRLYQDDYLNEHPVLLEYLSEGATVASQPRQAQPQQAQSRPQSAAQRSFVGRLRGAASAMADCEARAAPPSEVARSLEAALGCAEGDLLGPSANPLESVRRLIRAVDALRLERNTAVDNLAGAVPRAEAQKLARLAAKLAAENKQLRAENANVYILLEENKALKARLRGAGLRDLSKPPPLPHNPSALSPPDKLALYAAVNVADKRRPAARSAADAIRRVAPRPPAAPRAVMPGGTLLRGLAPMRRSTASS